MDPQTTLTELAAALGAGELATAAERLAAYYQWRVRGGLEPPAGDELAALAAARLTDALETPSILDASMRLVSAIDNSTAADRARASRVLEAIERDDDKEPSVRKVAELVRKLVRTVI